MKRQHIVWAAILLFSPFYASAYDGEYVVSGGFQTIVNAFTRIKFVFNDSQYATLLAGMVFMGMVIAALQRIGRAFVDFSDSGRGQMGFSWMVYTVMGSVMWFALMVPKGTIHVYDKSRNQYQPVSNIPDLIILTATITNSVYQGLYDVAFTNTASTTRFADEGMPIKVLMEVMTGSGVGVDPYVSKSISEMWKQCVPVAETRGFDVNELRYGSTTFNILSTLSALRNPAIFTTWYDSSAPSGNTVSCTSAYANLQAALGSPSTYDTRLKTICNKLGYESSNGTSYAYCKERMEESLQYVYGNTAISLTDAMTGIVVSQAIADALIQQNPEVAATMISNRSIVVSGLADANTNPEWLSTIMAGVIAIILSVTPLLVLIMVTPLVWSSFKLLMGMWIFITAWQTADAFLVQASTDEILTVLGEIKIMGFGLDAMQLAPSAAQKAMSVLASARTQAIYVATLISGLFGVTAYGLNSFASRSIQQMDDATRRAENAYTPEGRGQMLEQMKTGLAAQKTYSNVGDIDLMSRGAALPELTSIESSNAQINGFGGDLGQTASRSASVAAGNAMGGVIGTEMAAGAGQTSFQTAAAHSAVEAQSGIGQSRGIAAGAQGMGMNISAQAELTSSVRTAADTGDAKGIFSAGSHDLHTVGQRQESMAEVRNAEGVGETQGKRDAFGGLHGVEASTRFVSATESESGLGRSQGTREAAATNGLSVGQQSRINTSIGTQAEFGHNQGLKDSAATAGMSISGEARYNTDIGTQSELGRNRGVQDAADTSGLSIIQQSRTISDVDTQSALGRSQGEQDAALGSGMLIGQQARLNTGVQTASSTGESKGLLAAGNNSLQDIEDRQNTISGVRNSEVHGEAVGTKDAFGSHNNIQAASQTTTHESKAQHLADMYRQRDVINTIQNETGSTENQARSHLSDAESASVQAQLAANGYNGDRVVDTATYDAKQHVASQAGEKQAFSDLGVNPTDVARYSGLRSAHDTQASNEISQKLASELGGERARASAESGANHHLAITQEDATRLSESGLLSPEQAATVKGVSRVDMSLRSGENGLSGTSAVHSGHSASIDNSRTETSQSTIQTGVDAGDAISQRNQLQTAAGVRHLIDQSEIRSPGAYVDDLAMMSAQSLTPFMSADHGASTRTNTSITGDAGIGLKIPGTTIGGGITTVASHGSESSDNVNINAKAGQFKKELDRLTREGRVEARGRGLEGTQRDEFVKDYVSENYSRFYQTEYRNATQQATETAPTSVREQHDTPLHGSTVSGGRKPLENVINRHRAKAGYEDTPAPTNMDSGINNTMPPASGEGHSTSSVPPSGKVEHQSTLPPSHKR
ncbi:conjugal transfer protein TraG N-terminal domain-containing protein [Dickeya sp. NCPPB 3274]|uniref:conjugal transfer protein TraG N-terminal domain-containing protein n=1 Tax=Dickeya sp. NCPPB 3274 TaxID=568766 RepID=UPI0003A94F2A|nr:conjugal transfer protein TraG N-terminal domain-containing protein [Dickeya sp. NCPPB 3274]